MAGVAETHHSLKYENRKKYGENRRRNEEEEAARK
jgi:hypothetical protein